MAQTDHRANLNLGSNSNKSSDTPLLFFPSSKKSCFQDNDAFDAIESDFNDFCKTWPDQSPAFHPNEHRTRNRTLPRRWMICSRKIERREKQVEPSKEQDDQKARNLAMIAIMIWQIFSKETLEVNDKESGQSFVAWVGKNLPRPLCSSILLASRNYNW